MIIKLSRIISCSSEHPNFPASNLLHNPPPGPWKCAKPGEMLGTVIIELSESSCIIGLDIGNYRSCVVIVAASKSSEPDNWIQIIHHQFLSHDEAANNKFKDQVQLFTKKELNTDILKEKFDRVKVTCMQSANLKELFGLSFITIRTEVVVDMGIDVFGRFKMKADENEEKSKTSFKEKYLKLFPDKPKTYKDDLADKIKESGVNNFNKRQEEERKPRKRPLLEKLEAGKADEVFGKKTNEDSSESTSSSNGNANGIARTPFGDVIPTPDRKKNTPSRKNSIDSDVEVKAKPDDEDVKQNTRRGHKNRIQDDDDADEDNKNGEKNDNKCSVCLKTSAHEICSVCKRLPAPSTAEPPAKKPKMVAKRDKPKKKFASLMDDIKFALSGYVNPQRDEIRRKALKMGAKYIADPNTTNNQCTHLICAFKNTPKFQQLKGHAKIVSHIYVEEAFDQQIRFPWRRYALQSRDRKQTESEEETEGEVAPTRPLDPYEQETDSDIDDTDY